MGPSISTTAICWSCFGFNSSKSIFFLFFLNTGNGRGPLAPTWAGAAGANHPLCSASAAFSSLTPVPLRWFAMSLSLGGSGALAGAAGECASCILAPAQFSGGSVFPLINPFWISGQKKRSARAEAERFMLLGGAGAHACENWRTAHLNVRLISKRSAGLSPDFRRNCCGKLAVSGE